MVYGVFYGQYSDWRVFGYFEDKEKAEEFCERANKTAKYDSDELYIKELPNLENESIDDERICVEVETEDWSVEFGYGYGDEDGIIDYGDGTAVIIMMIHPSQYDRAAKIAQDRWARHKAEKAGIV